MAEKSWYDDFLAGLMDDPLKSAVSLVPVK